MITMMILITNDHDENDSGHDDPVSNGSSFLHTMGKSVIELYSQCLISIAIICTLEAACRLVKTEAVVPQLFSLPAARVGLLHFPTFPHLVVQIFVQTPVSFLAPLGQLLTPSDGSWWPNIKPALTNQNFT